MNGFEVVDPAGIELGEHPIWDPQRGRMGWVDVFAGELRWIDGAAIDRWGFPAPLGAAAVRQSGGVVAAAGSGIHFRDGAGAVDRAPITGLLPSGVRFNDGACDPAGNFVCGTMSVNGEAGLGCLYRVSPHGRIRTLLAGITESNGLAWSHDGQTMYYVDSGEPIVRRYRYDAELVPERGEDLCAIPDGQGVPDGICIDADGALWIGIWEGAALWHVSAQGELLEVVETPVSRPTCPGFGGRRLERLFVASAWEGMDQSARSVEPRAGHLLAYEPHVPGVPAFAFAG
jgi:sugar lactone lactonase YvrE